MTNAVASIPWFPFVKYARHLALIYSFVVDAYSSLVMFGIPAHYDPVVAQLIAAFRVAMASNGVFNRDAGTFVRLDLRSPRSARVYRRLYLTCNKIFRPVLKKWVTMLFINGTVLA